MDKAFSAYFYLGYIAPYRTPEISKYRVGILLLVSCADNQCRLLFLVAFQKFPGSVHLDGSSTDLPGYRFEMQLEMGKKLDFPGRLFVLCIAFYRTQ